MPILPPHVMATLNEMVEYLAPLGYTGSTWQPNRNRLLVFHDLHNVEPKPMITIKFSANEAGDMVPVIDISLPTNAMMVQRKIKKLIEEGMSEEEAITNANENMDRNAISMIASCNWGDPVISDILKKMEFYADVFDTYGSITT